ncbi:MAG: hypothetical protein ACM31C_19660 [Acidobacteriota bacterium]
MRRIGTALIISALLASPAFARGKTAAKTAKTAHAKKAATAAPKRKAPPVPVSAEHKKALAELYAGFKFGMSKDEVIAALQKKIDEKYEDKIKQTTDVAAQDRIRRDKKAELQRIAASYITFDGKRTGWDVSIIENEFAQNTGESMMDQWENQGGKNQRRFFFFYDGKLWKMFVSLDVSILPEDKKNFETFKSVMEAKYGAGNIDPGLITWYAGDFNVRAVDRLKDYDALGLVIEDPHVKSQVEVVRAEHAPPKKDTPAVIKAVIDPDHKDHYDVHANGGAVDAVIKNEPPEK